MDRQWFDDREARIPRGEVRTRFAPSPTGYMHIGNLRTALYTGLIARNAGGKFILRIEDTDQERLVEGATEVIYNTLRKCGLDWDEGPDKGGPVGPYIQTERRDLYGKYAQLLLEQGHAYRCFCTKERLDSLHGENGLGGYDGHCRDLSQEEIDEKLAAGVPYVIRQKCPTEGATTFHDEVFGDITVENSVLDDQILIKADGMPTYNFANVVDDHTMGITHVVRGNEYLSSTPQYNLLYEAFGWEIPTSIHVAPVMKDANNKLSKRNGDASFEDLVAKGYLHEAVINYIALLGWAPKGENEIFTLEELIQEFDVSGISKSPAIFDPAKLKAINGAYIRKLSKEQFIEGALPYIRQSCKKEDLNLDLLAELLQPRTEVYTDIPEQIDFIDSLPDYDIGLYTHKKMKTNAETSLAVLKEILPVLEGLSDWSLESINSAMADLVAKLGVKNGYVLWPLRVAVSGKQFTPGGGTEIAELLGKEETLRRIKIGIDKLSA